MTSPSLTKPTHHTHLEQSRKAQAPEAGARVLYPQPHPYVSHVYLDDAGEVIPTTLENGEPNDAIEGLPVHEIAVPTGDEEWFPARVISVSHIQQSQDPDGYAAYLQPLDEKDKDAGIPFTISVVFLRDPE